MPRHCLNGKRMRFTKRTGSGYLAAFNFSSLTDIVMLLLIFFLLTSSFVTTRGLDVVLPKADNSTATQDQRVLVSINDSGAITVNDQAATIETVPALVRTALQSDSTRPVVVRADQSIQLKDIVNVLDAVRGAGARRFFIATDEKK